LLGRAAARQQQQERNDRNAHDAGFVHKLVHRDPELKC
jgi:hypothetical protein